MQAIVTSVTANLQALLSPGPVHFLVYAMLLDFVTGWMVALKMHKANSSTSRGGVIRKAAYFGAIALAYLVDLVTKQEAPLAVNVTTLFLFFTEAVSVVEHLGVLGVPLPTWLKTRLTKLRDIYDMGGENPNADTGAE